MDCVVKLLDGLSLLNLFATVTTLSDYGLHFQEGLLPRATRLVLALPVHRSLERHAIEPRRRTGLTPEVRQRLPGSQQNLLRQVLTFVASESVSARNLDH